MPVEPPLMSKERTRRKDEKEVLLVYGATKCISKRFGYSIEPSSVVFK